MLTMLEAILIALRMLAFAPPDSIGPHVMAAAVASTTDVPTEVLIAIAWHESRLDPTATSYVSGGRRTGRRWPSRDRAAGDGPRFCGVMQVAAGSSWDDCLALRPLDVAYRRGREILSSWLRAADGDMAAALRGYGCGWAGMRGECRGFDRRVLRAARALGMPSGGSS